MRLAKIRITAWLALGLVAGLAYALRADTMKLSTYYPAPSGVYKKIITTATTLLARDGGSVGIGTSQPAGVLHVSVPPNSHASAPKFFSSGAAAGDLTEILLGESQANYRAAGIGYFNGAGAPSSRLLLFNYGDHQENGINLLGGGNVGIGTTAPDVRLTVNGNVRVGQEMGGPSQQGQQGRSLILSGAEWGDNTDPTFIQRFNVSENVTHLRLVVGDDPGDPRDRLVVGACPGGGAWSTFNPKGCPFQTMMSVRMDGQVEIRAGLSQNSNPDVAENIPASDPSIEGGDVVAADPGRPESILKASSASRGRMLGIVTDKPGLLLNAGWSEDPKVKPKPGERAVVLAGRVPVKVTPENGPIRIGDVLTASSKAGYAMRATEPGPALGIALEAFDGGPGSEGRVLCFVSLGERNLAGALADLKREYSERIQRLESQVSALQGRLSRR